MLRVPTEVGHVCMCVCVWRGGGRGREQDGGMEERVRGNGWQSNDFIKPRDDAC